MRNRVMVQRIDICFLPAQAIRRPSLGTLAVGAEGDATIIDIEQGAFEFHDTQGERLAACKAIVPFGRPGGH